jgi:hypothetical protein
MLAAVEQARAALLASVADPSSAPARAQRPGLGGQPVGIEAADPTR